MGAFAIYNDCDTDSTVISNLFIDEYMKEASDVQIKVYLYLLRMMGAGRSASLREMAEQSGHTESEAGSALLYWEKKGLLSMQRDSRGRIMSIHLCEVRPRLADEDEEQVISDNAENRVVDIAPVLEKKQAAAPSEENKGSLDSDKAQLMFIVEQYIGKPLSTSELQTIYYISDELHFSDDLVDYLVSYCVDRGKKDFRYIEKVALNWKENGIETAQDAKKAELSKSKVKRAPSAKKNGFNQFQQNSYDFDAIEKKLLEN